MGRRSIRIRGLGQAIFFVVKIAGDEVLRTARRGPGPGFGLPVAGGVVGIVSGPAESIDLLEEVASAVVLILGDRVGRVSQLGLLALGFSAPYL